MNDMKLGYVGLQSTKRSEWEAFAKACALSVSADTTDETLLLRMDDRHHRIAIHAGGDAGFQYSGWDMGSPAKLKDMIDRLTAAGLTVRDETSALAAERHVLQLHAFDDPFGFRHELFLSPDIRTDPLDTQGLRQAGFVTGDQGLGHVVYGVPDIDAGRAFYMDVMGFRLTDMVRGFLTADFLRCNPRHHSLALSGVPDAPPHFQHLMIQYDLLDDLGRAIDRVAALDAPVAATLGRHNNDMMVSTYVGCPSGFMIEMGWGAIRIDDEQAWAAKVHEPSSVWGHRWSGPPQ